MSIRPDPVIPETRRRRASTIDWLRDKPLHEPGTFENWVTLSKSYVQMLEDHPVPIDLKIAARFKIPAEQRQELVNGAQLMITKHDVCPYLVAAIGYGHDAAWQAALKLVGVNPAIAVLVGLGFGAFWVWVYTHC